jgi:hypothetical protein
VDPKIRLIREKSSLEGTAYFEFLPGYYDNEHWNDSSVFLDEEIMYLIERPFMDVLPDHDHYSSFDVSLAQWQAILSNLEKLRGMLASAEGIHDVADKFCCIWPGTEQSFGEDFERNRKDLIDLITEFNSWVNLTLKKHDTIAILGM